MQDFCRFQDLPLQNPEFKILADFKNLALQNPELKILSDFKILAFQNPEFKILADFKILAFQNPKFSILDDFMIFASKILLTEVTRISVPPLYFIDDTPTVLYNQKYKEY